MTSSTDGSRALFDRALAVTPGGVNSPVRAFTAVGGTPRFIESANGAWLRDVDGNEYVDLICSWGPMLLGHAHPEVEAAVAAAVSRGTSYGTPTVPEVELAEEIVARTPVDKVRFVSSGTEATMSAIRLARGFTGRDVIVKFAGCYHGHVDSLLASAGSGLVTHAVPGHAGRARVLDRAHRRAALQRHRRGREGLCRVRRPHRLPDHGSGARQHGRGSADPGLQPVPGSDLLGSRRAVHLRRGDDRFPGEQAGAVGPRRCGRGLASRPDDLRQGDGRRLPRRSVRRPG